MQRYLPAVFTVALVADLTAHTLRYGPPDPVVVVSMAAVVALLSGLPFLVAFDGATLPTDAGEYGHRLTAALGIALVVGVAGFWATRGLFSGQEELLVRLVLYAALVHVSARVANLLPVAGERFPETGRYWGTPWEDRETVAERSDE